jgi:hypothetical protein
VNSLTRGGTNSQHQPTTFLATARKDTSPGPRSVQMSTKPAGVCLRCNLEPLAPCWMLLLGEPPAEDQPKADFPVPLPVSLCSCLPEGLSHHGIGPTAPSQLWRQGNSSSGGALCPLPESRLGLGLIWVCLMLCWRRPVWFQHLAFFFFPHLLVPASARGSDLRVKIVCG